MYKSVIRIHCDYYDIIKQFGSPSKVANSMVELMRLGLIDPADMRKAPEPIGRCTTCSVTIHNDYYEQLVSLYGATSPKLSLRRYLYHFVEEELYSQYAAYFPYEAERESKGKTLTLANLLRRKL